MTSITFPLKPGDNNDNVANLKVALLLLLQKQQIQIPAQQIEFFSNLLNKEVGYGDGTTKLVTVFQQTLHLDATGLIDEATATELNKILTQLGVINQEPASNQTSLGGFIYMDYGIPANNVKLRLYSKAFAGADTVVTETNTNEQGQYTLAYDPAIISNTNFEVRAVDAAGKEHALSSTLYNTDKTVSISNLNLIAPTEIQPVTESEFSRLSRDVSSVIGDIGKLQDAQEQDDRQDITLLSQNTNWDARTIALASLAGQLSATTSLPQEAAYAIVRAGLPTDADQLAQGSADDVNSALQLSNKAGIVNLTDDQIKAAVSTFQIYSNKTKLSTKDYSSLSSYDDLLTTLQFTDAEKSTFASAYFATRKDAAELWQKAKDGGIGEDKIKSLQLQGKLGMLTANNAQLAQNLQGIIQDADNLSKLVDEGLYEPQAWDAKLKGLAGTNDDNADALAKLIPPAYIGGTIADRKDAYITDMAAKVRDAFPEKVIRNRIETSKIVLGNDATQTGVSNFLAKAEPLGYKIGTTHIDSFVIDNGDTLFNGATAEQKAIAVNGVKFLSRIHQVTPNDEAVPVLLELGHSYAQDIIAVPKDDFINRFAKNYSEKYKVIIDDGRRIGRLIYNKSQQVFTTTYSFYTATKAMQQAPPLYATHGSPEQQKADKDSLADKIKGAPNLQELFGSLDFCECEHCHSVLSPAAYLVDLLQFLDRKETDWQYFLDKWKTDHAGKNYEDTFAKPYDALIDRRPDIINLPLTCENTETALPYIDIVNEILEYYVVNKKLTVDAAYDTGDTTTPELLAEPQNVEPAAYSILKKILFPLTLPFDLWIETVRQFCNQYDTPLWQLLKTMQPVTGTDFDMKKKIAVESLNISPDEFAIFSNEDSLTTLFQLYGYSSQAEMTTKLKSAKELANRLGVTYIDLVSLVETAFINPQLSIAIVLQKMSVTVNDIFRFKKAAGFASFTDDEQQAFKDKLAKVKDLYGTDAEAVLDKAWDDGAFEELLLLNDTNTACNFDATTVGYVDRDALNFDLLKFNLFVRLWKKLGWSIQETDAALNVFLPLNLRSIFSDAAKAETDRAKALAQAFGSALINIAHLVTASSQIAIGNNAYLKLSTLWADIPIMGSDSLYNRLFLSRNVLKIDTVFDDALGQYLAKDIKIQDVQKDHSVALQASLNISATDIEQILADNGLDIKTAQLSLPNVSLLYRYSLLAKALKLSVPGLISFKQLSGLNPFTPLSADALPADADDHFLHQTLQFINWVLEIQESDFTLDDINYLFRHHFDVTGKYRNVQSDADTAIQLLANEINRIRSAYAIPSNPADATDLTLFAAFTDDILVQNLSFVVPANTVQAFMAMWTNKQQADWNIIKSDAGSFLTEDKFNALFVPDAENSDDGTRQTNLLNKRSLIANSLLPFIQQKLIYQSVIQILSTTTATQPSRIEWLISDAAHLHDVSQPQRALREIFAEAGDSTEIVNIERAYFLLSKVIQLANGLQLSDKELKYFFINGADFNKVDWSKIPVDGTEVLADAQILFSAFMRLSDYTYLRQDLAGGGDDIIDLFAGSRLFYDGATDPATTKSLHLNALYQQISNLTRRDINTVTAVAQALAIDAISQNTDGKLFVTAEAFSDERGVILLWNALKLARAFGVSVATLTDAIQITTIGLDEEKYQAIAENFKNAVKAQYELSAWQQIAQPVFDFLRQKRRDALVAYLLHQFPDLFSSTEEMYEYFLIDPGTEPVVQTSRIRIATASVQLFIQRILLNLENRWNRKVPPTAINAKYWQWMNRYRVWEANRKILLWPENWLEPEWRDDKTYLFKELEGKLLQGDVSNDLVEDAFFVYLKKLEVLARLDIVAMYCEENAVTPEANIIHVIARTFAFPHQYFYRKYAQEMWTSWEQVDAEIDGNHIVIITWRGRLHIFWVTFIEKIDGTSNAPSSGVDSNTNLSDWKVSDALSTVTSGAQRKTLQAHLHWSDYYQEKWSSKQSGGLDNPVSKTVDLSLTSDDITITISKEPDVSEGIDGAVNISLSNFGLFRVANKNTSPETSLTPNDVPKWNFFTEGAPNMFIPLSPMPLYYSVNRLKGYETNRPLSVTYPHLIKTLNGNTQETQSDPQIILGKAEGFYNLVPCSVPVTMGGSEFGPLVTPFFYQDSWNTFYVEPILQETVTINNWDEWVGGPTVVYLPAKVSWDQIKVNPYHPWPKTIPLPKNSTDPAWIDANDSRIKVSPAVRQDWATNPGTYVKFGDKVIGKDSGMNVVLINENASPVLIKDSGQLNSVLHNVSNMQNIMLVPGDKSGGISASTIVDSNLLKDGIGVKSNTVLVSGAGLTATQTIGIAEHVGDIFNRNISTTKSIGVIKH